MCLQFKMVFDAFASTVLSLHFRNANNPLLLLILSLHLCYIVSIKNIFIVTQIHAVLCKNSISFSPILPPSFCLHLLAHFQLAFYCKVQSTWNGWIKWSKLWFIKMKIGIIKNWCKWFDRWASIKENFIHALCLYKFI